MPTCAGVWRRLLRARLLGRLLAGDRQQHLLLPGSSFFVPEGADAEPAQVFETIETALRAEYAKTIEQK